MHPLHPHGHGWVACVLTEYAVQAQFDEAYKSLRAEMAAKDAELDQLKVTERACCLQGWERHWH
jgi:hypothetical protein